MLFQIIIIILLISILFYLIGIIKNNNVVDFFLIHPEKQIKIIWMYWEQGEKNLKDKYNKICIYGWRKLNPDWKVIVLDKNTVKKYIPEIINYEHLTIQLRSDLIRVKLLNKYGGVWADASTLPLKRLTGNIENIDNNTSIFFYRFIPKEDVRMISSWFIISKHPNHYLINRLDKLFSERVKKKKKRIYFYFHKTLSDLYDTDSKIKDYIDKLTITKTLPNTKMKNSSLKVSNIKNLPLMFKRNKNIKEDNYKKYINEYLKLY